MTWSQFVSSPVVASLVMALVGEILRRTVSSKDRRAQLLGIAKRVFEAVEQIGKLRALNGPQKLDMFLGMVDRQLKYEKRNVLTEGERGMLTALAEQVSWIGKAVK